MKGEMTAEDVKRNNAKEALDRWVHYMERFQFHEQGQKDAVKQKKDLEKTALKLRELVGCSKGQMSFLYDGWETVFQVTW